MIKTPLLKPIIFFNFPYDEQRFYLQKVAQKISTFPHGSHPRKLCKITDKSVSKIIRPNY